MISVGDICTLTIDDVAYGGDGVGRIDGVAVFVPFTLEGEEVRIEITHTKPTYARARVRDVVRTAADRVTPPCRWYGLCAGCQYQHMNYNRQLRTKEKQVRALIERIGKIQEAPVESIVPAPHPWNYRTKITLHGPGKPAYVGIDHTQRVPIDRCPIAQETLNAGLADWNQRHPAGVAGKEDLTLRVDKDGRVWNAVGRSGQRISQQVLNQSFTLPLTSFFQINPDVADRLATAVCKEVRDSGCRYVVDAYAGVGVFGLLAAKHVEQVYAIESDAAAVRSAKKNAGASSTPNFQVIKDRVERGMKTVLQEVKGPDTICIIDPPRKGCPPEVIQALGEARVKTVLYISCSPDRLARDGARWKEVGYHLKRVQAFDMFPQTAHIEALAVFTAD